MLLLSAETVRASKPLLIFWLASPKPRTCNLEFKPNGFSLFNVPFLKYSKMPVERRSVIYPRTHWYYTLIVPETEVLLPFSNPIIKEQSFVDIGQYAPILSASAWLR